MAGNMTPRVAWIDAARGIAILLLVTNHSSQQLELYGWDTGIIRQVDMRLAAFRQPLFFAVAGTATATSIAHLDFRNLFRRRLLLLLWIFLLWSTIWWACFLALPRTADRADYSVPNPLTALVLPTSPMWFLYALLLYTVFAWAVRRFPWWAQLSGAATVSVLFTTRTVAVGASYQWWAIGTYLVFFMVGVVGRNLILFTAERVNWMWFAVALLTFAAGTQLTIAVPLRGATRLAFSFVGIALGISAAVLLTRLTRISRTLQWVGRRALPIYVVHGLVIVAILASFAAFIGVGGPSPETAGSVAAANLGPWIGAAMYPALSIVSIGVAVGLYKATRRTPGAFDLPPFPFRVRKEGQPAPTG